MSEFDDGTTKSMRTPIQRAYDQLQALRLSGVHHATRAWETTSERCAYAGCANLRLRDESFGCCKECYDMTIANLRAEVRLYQAAKERDELCPGIRERQNDPYFFFSITCGKFKSKPDNRRCAECGSIFRRAKDRQIQAQEREKRERDEARKRARANKKTTSRQSL